VIHRADFTRILYQEALRQGVRIEFDARVVNINFESGSVILHTGRIMQAGLILGADGEHSLCRELFQGPSESFRSICGDMVYRLMIPSSVLAVDPMLDFLVKSASIQAWYGPGSHAITYHMDRDETLNVVLTLPTSTETYTIGPQLADLQVLRQKFRTWDPRFQRLISLADHVQCWSLFEYAILSKWEHSAGKFILLGDAAHPVLPYMCVFLFIPPIASIR
jgi:salicylate hydroxylase